MEWKSVNVKWQPFGDFKNVKTYNKSIYHAELELSCLHMTVPF